MFKHSVAKAMTAVHFEAITLLLWLPCCLVLILSYSSFNQSEKPGTIRESNQASGVRKAHYA